MTRFDWMALKEWPPRRRSVFLETSFVASLVAGAFLVRIWGMSRMHFWDENVYLLNAGFIGWNRANYTEIGSRPPLLSILFAGVFHLWHSDYAAWIVTASLNALGPAFLYLAGRRIVGRISAALAALLLAFTPFFAGILPDGSGGFVPNTSGHSLLTDSPALTLILLSLWLLLRALEKQTDIRFALAGLGFALTVLMRFGSLSSVGVLSLLVLAANRRVRAALARRRRLCFGHGAVSMLVAPALRRVPGNDSRRLELLYRPVGILLLLSGFLRRHFFVACPCWSRPMAYPKGLGDVCAQREREAIERIRPETAPAPVGGFPLVLGAGSLGVFQFLEP